MASIPEKFKAGGSGYWAILKKHLWYTGLKELPPGCRSGAGRGIKQARVGNAGHTPQGEMISPLTPHSPK